MAARDVAALLRLAMAHMANPDKFHVVLSALVLARMAALFRPGVPHDVTALSAASYGALLGYLRKQVALGVALSDAGAAAGGGARTTEAAAVDARLLASVMHALAKLPGGGAVARELFADCLAAGAARLESFPPRPLAMFVWAAAKRGYAAPTHEPLYRRASDLSVSGVVAAWPKYEPPAPAGGGGGKPSASPFDPAECAMLLTGYATAGVRSPEPYARAAAYMQPLLPYASQSAITSAVWALTRPAADGGHILASGGAGAAPAFLAAAAQEVALRLQLRSRAWRGGAAVDGDDADGGLEDDATEQLSALARHASRDGDGDGDDVDAAGGGAGSAAGRAALQALAAAAPALRGGGSTAAAAADDSDEREDGVVADSAARRAPFSPRTLSTVLHAYAAANVRAAVLFRAAAVYLSTVSVASATDSGGTGGYRPLGSHASDAAAGRQARRGGGGRGDDGGGGDVAIVSTYDPASCAAIAWAFARSRYEDDRTPALWAGIVAAMRSRATAAARKAAVAAAAGPAPPGAPTAAPTLRANHLASVLWATARVSVAAPSLAEATLRHMAAVGVAGYSIPALAQVLWAAALQGVYDRAVWDAALTHAVDLALVRARGARGGGSGGGARGHADDPDHVVAALLRTPGEGGTAATKLQVQLHTAVLGATLEAGWTPPTQEVAAAAGVWRQAAALAAPRPSKLQADVLRVLTAAEVAPLSEFVTPAGLVVDVLVPAPVTAAGRPAWAIEVQGPTHFVRGVDAVLRNAGAAAAAAAASPAEHVHARDTLLGHAGEPGGGGGGGAALVPTLATRAKHRWLAAGGYTVVPVTWREWAEYPSTQEKCDLLASKGIPIPAAHRSY